MDRYIKAPISDEDARSLRAGDYVYITGTIYTARDAAHKRMYEALANNEELPMKMQNNIETETAGTVTSVMVNVGDSVMEGAVLVTIA